MKSVASLSFWLFTACIGSAQLTIIIDQIPAYTPPGDAIYIAGDFQGWDPGNPEYRLEKDTLANHHIITLEAGLGAIEFKFTRGSWARVEGDAAGMYVPNRTYSGDEGDTVRLQILGWEDLVAICVPPAPPGDESTAATNVHILSDTFYMPQFDRCRRIWVYLPPDYVESDRRYPVMYMHDGQNVFDETTSLFGEWEVDETLNRLYEEGDSGIIVVAIDNGNNYRTEEYIPWANTGLGETRGKLYADFIVNTLKPVIDDTYRTLPNRNNTAIMGSSFGGVISSYCGLEYQDVFSKVGAFSQSYWVSEHAFIHADTTGKQADMRIYQLMGALEGSEAVEDMYRMETTLHGAGFGKDEVISVEKADGAHSEWFWAREFEAAYLWLFRNESVADGLIIDPGTNIRLFPNPAFDYITIELLLQQSQDVSIEFYDTFGRLIMAERSRSWLAGEYHHTIDLPESLFSDGMYYCRVLAGSQSFVGSIAIHR